MSGPAKRLCLRRLVQHCMFTLNAAVLSGGNGLLLWWRSGDPAAGLDWRELSSATFFGSCEDARLGGEPVVDGAIGLGCVFFFKWLRGGRGKAGPCRVKEP